jgi:hypothetical protein
MSILITIGFQVIADWSVSHMRDPNWPPHAHYHLLVYHFTLMLFGGVALYRLCGPARAEPWSLQFAAFTGIAFWLPFYPAALFPQASLYATPELAGHGIPVNLILGAALIGMSALGYVLARASSSTRESAGSFSKSRDFGCETRSAT